MKKKLKPALDKKLGQYFQPLLGFIESVCLMYFCGHHTWLSAGKTWKQLIVSKFSFAYLHNTPHSTFRVLSYNTRSR